MTEWLRRQLSLPEHGPQVETSEAPPGWNMTVENNRARLNHLDARTRQTGAVVAWFIVYLARWLAARTGFPLAISPSVRPGPMPEQANA